MARTHVLTNLDRSILVLHGGSRIPCACPNVHTLDVCPNVSEQQEM